MTLLAQSQNLTAAILAIEQITGPVVANQVVLQGEAIARSSASVLQIQKLLDAARKDEEQKKTKFEEIKAVLDKAIAEHKQKEEALKAKEAEIEKAKVNGKLPPEKQKLESELEKLKSELEPLSKKKTMAEMELQKAQKSYEEAQEIRKKLEANKDAVFAQSSATAKGEGKLAETARNPALEPEVKTEVVKAVDSIVERVLKKTYVVESCLALMADNPPRRKYFKDKNGKYTEKEEKEAENDYQDALDGWKKAREFCKEYLNSKKPS